MSEHSSPKAKVDFKPLDVGVGAGAAVVTAFATSYLGTAGTLLGAALASVVGSISTSVLRTSAERTNESLQRSTARLRQAMAVRQPGAADGATKVDPGVAAVDVSRMAGPGADDPGRLAGSPGAGREAPGDGAGLAAGTAESGTGPPGRVPHNRVVGSSTSGTGGGTPGAGGTGAAGAADRTGAGAPGTGDRTGPGAADATDDTPATSAARPRWLMLAGGAVVAFVLALLAITIIEAAVGKPLAALVGKDSGGGTTIGRTVGENPAPKQNTPAPTRAPTTTAPGSPTPDASPNGPPTTTSAPTSSPAPEPSATPRHTGGPATGVSP